MQALDQDDLPEVWVLELSSVSARHDEFLAYDRSSGSECEPGPPGLARHDAALLRGQG